MELLEFRRRILTDYVKEDETKRHEQQQQQQQQVQLLQQQQEKNEVKCQTFKETIAEGKLKYKWPWQIESNIYENVAELNASTNGEDKVDGLSNTKEFPVWKKNETGSQSTRSADSSNCVLLRVKKNSSDAQTKQQPGPGLANYPPHPLRGTTSYSSGTSLSSYASSSTSWSSRMKMAMNRKLSSSGTEPTLAVDDASDANKKEK